MIFNLSHILTEQVFIATAGSILFQRKLHESMLFPMSTVAE
jgi:hypothetical protein